MALGFSPRDQRSRRLVAVIECALNQNARDAGAASYPAVNKALLTLCMRYDVGVVQIPCPEMRFMGLSRERPPGKSIREVLDTAAGCQCCLAISLELVSTLRDYQNNHCRLLAILGGNSQSPGCAVHVQCDTADPGRLAAPSGVLMRILQEELRKQGIDVPFKGMRDCDQDLLQQDLRWLEALFKNT
ncbi:hypothetical protein [Candidatus Accumulibacter sp. ACC003]|jgi:predicted secreted protein|uniref:hypothetical protein n=1 Tax=Candidatus Accumulibacter sp. ACC003 TaxID=2823334 RepID=UPI0025BCC4DA|nr:hypothetical protein [Candidatus Accumulibacter sp. ACC003]